VLGPYFRNKFKRSSLREGPAVDGAVLLRISCRFIFNFLGTTVGPAPLANILPKCCWDSNVAERALLEHRKGTPVLEDCSSAAVKRARCGEVQQRRKSDLRMHVAVTWSSRDGCTVR
jgi:hypothetical protein